MHAWRRLSLRPMANCSDNPNQLIGIRAQPKSWFAVTILVASVPPIGARLRHGRYSSPGTPYEGALAGLRPRVT